MDKVASEIAMIVTLTALMVAGFIVVDFASRIAVKKGKADIIIPIYWFGIILAIGCAVLIFRLGADALGRLG